MGKVGRAFVSVDAAKKRAIMRAIEGKTSMLAYSANSCMQSI